MEPPQPWPFVPDDAGTWQVRITNFPESDPGANVTVEVSWETPVAARPPTPAASGPARVRTPGSRQVPQR